VLVSDEGATVIARWWNDGFKVGDLPGAEIFPTHWQPLPAAPTQEQQG